eukprot:NODE_1259_length_1583_cov_0.318733.p1 type:complete len:304 gc:universal NODE_1259_length_1583_cov_0.318733:446-1357(+)
MGDDSDTRSLHSFKMNYSLLPYHTVKENHPKSKKSWKYAIILILFIITIFSFKSAWLSQPSKPNYNMIIAITTSIQDYQRRMAVRNTWKKNIPKDSILIFFMGQSNFTHQQAHHAQLEIDNHQDVVLLDMVDSYRNLTIKMTKIHEYVADHFTANWLFKTDTDVWINVDRLMKLYKNYQPRTVISKLAKNFDVLKSGSFKNLVYSNSKYPTFPSGCGYGLSFDIVQYLAQQSKLKWLKIMPNEDATLGVWLSGLNTTLIHTNDIDGEHLRCQNRYLLVHHIQPYTIYEKQANFETCGNHCGCK